MNLESTQPKTTIGGGAAPHSINNRLATVNDAKIATGKTSMLPGNKCITVDEMNAMIGSSNTYEIPTAALQDMLETGVTVLAINYTNEAVGMINVSCNGYENSYDLQNGNSAICINVGSRGDITSGYNLQVNMETGGWQFTVFIRPSYTDGYQVAEMFGSYSEYDSETGGRYIECAFGSKFYSALVIAEKYI